VIVRNVFDRILARGFPLHCAVLDRDTDAVETLLQGSDINVVDRVGRITIHIFVAQRPGNPLCAEITNKLFQH